MSTLLTRQPRSSSQLHTDFQQLVISGNASEWTLFCAIFKKSELLLRMFSYHKAWKILGLHPLCALLFTAGYALREYGAYNYLYEHNNTTLIIFVVSQVLIYVCP